MRGLSTDEAAAVERAAAEPMLAHVEAWARVNSGSRNLEGLATLAGLLADAVAALPGELRLAEAAPVEAMEADGTFRPVAHGRNLHLVVRPEAPVQMLLTGHMDTVYGVDHPFQRLEWLGPKVLRGPGVADMKGGLAVMLAALTAGGGSPARGGVGVEGGVNSGGGGGGPGSGAFVCAAGA